MRDRACGKCKWYNGQEGSGSVGFCINNNYRVTKSMFPCENYQLSRREKEKNGPEQSFFTGF